MIHKQSTKAGPVPLLRPLRQGILAACGCVFVNTLAIGASGTPSPLQNHGITIDGTLSAARTLSGPNYTITADMGRQLGSNLFHSFGAFNLENGESAVFSGPASIANVIGRVTGGSPSTIDGTLGCTISGANLYLINPNGLLFGPHAALDIGGSFYASSATYLRFADGARFDAVTPSASTLTMAPPAAFGFLSAAPAGVTVRGANLHVGEGKDLALVGGSIDIADGAYLSAPAGRMLLASTQTGAEIGASDGIVQGGDIALSGGSELDVSARNGGGAVVIRGGRLQLDASNIVAATTNGKGGTIDIAVGHDVALSAGANISTNTNGQGDGGDIKLAAGETVSLSGRAVDGGYTAIHANTSGAGNAGRIDLSAPVITIDDGLIQSLTLGRSGGPTQYGNGGAIAIQTDRLSLRNGGQLDSGSRTGSNGNGGSVDIAARSSVTVSGVGSDGYASVIFANVDGDGTGGHIAIRAPQVTVADGAKLAVSTSGAGKGGSIDIQTGQLTLAQGGEISANTSGTGAGGNVDISATDAIAVSGVGSTGSFSGILANTSGSGTGGRVKLAAPRISVDDGLVQALSTAAGNAGGVGIQAAELVLTNGGQVSSSSRNALGGNGGNVEISATSRIGIAGKGTGGAASGVFANTAGSGKGGNITLSAPSISLSDGGTVQATASAAGDGGAIRVQGTRVELGGGAVITTNTSGTGDGGSVDITATDTLAVSGQSPDGVSSAIRANTSGAGNGGSLHLTAGTLAMDSGLIQARTSGNRAPGGRNGNAGNISIHAGEVRLLDGSQIDSGSRGDSNGNGGNVDISATGLVLFSGTDAAGFESGIFANTLGDGHGGRVGIEAPQVRLDHGARLTVSASGAGAGGDVQIDAGTLDVAGSSTINASSSGSGTGGNVLLHAATISVSDAATVHATTSAAGSGGSVHIDTGTLALTGGAEISTNTSGPGSGGSVDISASGIVSVSGHDANGYSSAIRSNTNGSGKGGSVQLAANTLLVDSGLVQALTFGDRAAGGQNGDAGNIAIRATDVTLVNNGQIDSGSRGDSNGKGGSVDIRASGTVGLSGASSGIFANTFGDGDGGSVHVAAPLVALDGGSKIQASTAGAGTGGFIRVESTDLKLTGGSFISANTSGAGAGGYVNVNAAKSITLSGRDANGYLSSILASTFGSGNGGNVTVTAPIITLDFGLIQALSSGTLPDGAKNGRGGSILIDAGSLTLTNGGQIDSSSRNGSTGAGGDVLISARDFIKVSGVGPVYPTAIFANTFGSGPGGLIYLSTPSLVVEKGATVQATTSSSGFGGDVLVYGGRVDVQSGGTISAATYGSGDGGRVWIVASDGVTVTGRGTDNSPSAITATSAGAGNGGQILVQTPIVTVDDAEISTGSSAGGAGGRIGIEAQRAILLQNGGGISSTSTGTGNAGDILLQTGIFAADHSAVTTEAAFASGGNILIDATTARLANHSELTATVGGGFGDGGNVTLRARGIGAIQGSSVTARADQGHGGRITIDAEAFLRGPDVTLDASSNVIGNEGVVAINAPRLDISGSLVVLPSAFLDAAALLNDPCASGRGGEESSFVIKGRGGIPIQPDDPLPSSGLAPPPHAGAIPGRSAAAGLDCGKLALVKHGGQR